MNRGRDRGLVAGLLAGWLLGSGLLGGCGGKAGAWLDARRDHAALAAWVTMSQDSTGAVRPLVVVSVPHAQLVFRRDGDVYAAGLEARVVAWRGEQQVGGGVARTAVQLEHYAATRTQMPLEVAVPLHVRGEEPVELAVTAQALATTRVWRRALAFAPRAVAAMPIWIADLRTDLEPAPDGALMVPAAADSVRLAVVLRPRPDDPAWPEGGVDLVSEVTGAALAQPRRLRTPIAGPVGAAQSFVEQAWPADQLPFGRLRLRVLLEAQQAGQRWQLPREPALSVVNLRVDVRQDRSWRRHVAWLEGLLPAAARDSLRDVEPAERPAAWSDAWRRIGAGSIEMATAAEQRHLLRIIAADDRFSGFGRGALSDRGRVFVRWGEPALIETYFDDRVPGAVYEIWNHPAAGLRFIFYDAHGNGDFRLRHTEPLAP